MKNKIDMCNGPILKQMIIYFVPILLTGILQQLFNTVDVILASKLTSSGNNTVAAVSTATIITRLLISFFIGCSSGSIVTLAHAIGSKNKKSITETIHTAMLLSIILGSILTLVGITLTKHILILIHTPEYILKQATLYLQTYFLSMIPNIVYNFGAAILKAFGETKKPLYFLLIAGPIKIILTVVFVYYFKMDVIGLSLATTCSLTVSATLVIISLIKRNDDCKLHPKQLKISILPLKKILRLGIPAGIQSATYSLSGAFIQSSVNTLSHIEGFITGNAAALNIEAYSDIFTGPFFQCALNFTGQNVGAKNHKRVKKSFVTCSFLSAVVISLFSIFVLVFAKQILGLYITNSEEAIKWGYIRICIIFVPLIFQALMDTTAGALRGLGISISNTATSLLGICGFRILWCLTIFQIPQFHTPQVLFVVYPISWVMTYLIQLVLYNKYYKKLIKK